MVTVVSIIEESTWDGPTEKRDMLRDMLQDQVLD